MVTTPTFYMTHRDFLRVQQPDEQMLDNFSVQCNKIGQTDTGHETVPVS